eukprot:scaffold8319_cov211-Ochromonas_danica.AAC.7
MLEEEKKDAVDGSGRGDDHGDPRPGAESSPRHSTTASASSDLTAGRSDIGPIKMASTPCHHYLTGKALSYGQYKCLLWLIVVMNSGIITIDVLYALVTARHAMLSLPAILSLIAPIGYTINTLIILRLIYYPRTRWALISSGITLLFNVLDIIIFAIEFNASNRKAHFNLLISLVFFFFQLYAANILYRYWEFVKYNYDENSAAVLRQLAEQSSSVQSYSVLSILHGPIGYIWHGRGYGSSSSNVSSTSTSLHDVGAMAGSTHMLPSAVLASKSGTQSRTEGRNSRASSISLSRTNSWTSPLPLPPSSYGRSARQVSSSSNHNLFLSPTVLLDSSGSVSGTGTVSGSGSGNFSCQDSSGRPSSLSSNNSSGHLARSSSIGPGGVHMV